MTIYYNSRPLHHADSVSGRSGRLCLQISGGLYRAGFGLGAEVLLSGPVRAQMVNILNGGVYCCNTSLLAMCD